MVETTENYHRIPVSEGHTGEKHRPRTITLGKGIKAIWCAACNVIMTYLFDVNKYTMAEAQAWVRAHKKDIDVDRLIEYLGLVEVDCLDCGGACCKDWCGGKVKLTIDDHERLKALFEKPSDYSEDGFLIQNEGICKFLGEGLCSIYEERPSQCREFPKGELSCLMAQKTVQEGGERDRMDEKHMGELSIDELRGQLQEQAQKPLGAAQPIRDIHVRDVFENHIILEWEGKLYQATYATTGTTALLTPEADWKEVRMEYQEKATEIIFHASMKAVGDDEERAIEGYASTPDLDRQGEILPPEAFEKGLEDYLGNPILLYQHGEDPEIAKNPIGRVVELALRPGKGLWIRALIAEGDKHADRVWNLIKQGMLNAFSVRGMYEKVKNVIKRWDLTEISIVSVPANQRTLFSIAKAFEAGTDLVEAEQESTTDAEHQETAGEGQVEKETAKNVEDEQLSKSETESEVNKKVSELDETRVAELIQEGLKADREAREAKETAEKERQEEVKAEADKMFEAMKAELRKQMGEGVPFPTDDDRGTITVGSKYDDVDAGALAFAAGMLHEAGQKCSGEMLAALGHKVGKELESGELNVEEGGKALSFGRELSKAGSKANELMYSTYASYGDDWVPEAWSADLWRKARQETIVLPLFRQIMMPTNPYNLPIESTDPTVYAVSETTGKAALVLTAPPVTESKVGTGKQTLTAKKLGALVEFSEELSEDSIIPVAAMIRDQMGRALGEGVDDALFNGDTETGATGNINDVAGAPAGTEKWIIFNGLRKLPLVTTTANSRSAGVLTVEDYNQLRPLMGTNGIYGTKTSDLAFIVDNYTWFKTLELDELLTPDKYGAAATLLRGEIGRIWGVPVLNTGVLGKANTSGKVDLDTTGNNTTGSIVCVYKPGWMVGWRRRMTLEQVRLAFADANYIVAFLRIAFINFDNEVAAESYNVTL